MCPLICIMCLCVHVVYVQNVHMCVCLQVVVPLDVSDLGGSVSGNQLTSRCALRSSGSWKSAVSTHTEFNLEVVGPASRMGSGVIWTFSLDNSAGMSRRTEEWNVNVSLTTAGRYKVSVKAFNPISWASFCTHILVQEPVGELLLNVPSVLMTNRKHPVSFSVTAGSNVTVSLLVNATLLYSNSSYATGEEAMVVLNFDHTGTVVVELQAENRVSSQNKRVRVSVEGNRKSSPQVRINPTWQAPISRSPVHDLADNGENVFLMNSKNLCYAFYL